MVKARDVLVGEIQSIRSELRRLLEGIDDYFDRKPKNEEWSARELVFHLVDTPGSGGWGRIVPGVMEGSVEEIPIAFGQIDMTETRRGKDARGAREEFETVLSAMENILTTSTDAELAEKKGVYRSRSMTYERNVQEMIENIAEHWREHLGQLDSLRKEFGVV